METCCCDKTAKPVGAQQELQSEPRLQGRMVRLPSDVQPSYDKCQLAFHYSCPAVKFLLKQGADSLDLT